MKTRESGMPAEEVWQEYFDPVIILEKLGLTSDCDCVVDFGCGYGTFSIPAAQIVRGVVHALDVDPDMVATTAAKAKQLPNLFAIRRDFLADGCGLPEAVADYVMLFNILHAVEASLLVLEAKRVLRLGGKLAVVHWNYNPTTPRGPSMEIRLQPAECITLVQDAGLAVSELVDLPPYHYGFVASR
jgi:SAM-dependent methyltransferase